jgi:DNA gyrase subunit B
MAPKPQKYDESNIQAHVGLDGLRKRPSMYIGELGNHAVFHLIKEGFDNVVDEMFAGRNTLGEVVSCGRNSHGQ